MALTLFDLYNGLGLTDNNGTQTLVNAIRNSAGLSDMVQVWDGSVAGLQEFGTAVNKVPARQNAFLNELIDRIGLVVITQASLRNPLGRFKKGRIDMGRSVQEIFTDLVNAQSFNPEDAEQTLFKRNAPNTKVLFHDNWRKEMFATTIEREELTHAFISQERFESFIMSVYNALYNSNEVNEYIWTKALMEAYVNNGLATYVAMDQVVDQVTAQEFVKLARQHTTLMTLPMGSRNYNASGVHTRTPRDRIWIIMSAAMEAAVDVDVLAYAFNMDKAELKARTLVIDNFATPGLECIICDEDIFKIYDREFTMRTIENPKGMYWNVFLHVWQLFSMSKFHNFIAFMSAGIPAVQRLTLTPMARFMQAGSSATFNGIIISADDTTTLTATVTDATGTAVTGATAVITQTGGDTSSGTYSVLVTLPSTVTPNANLNLTITATNSTGTAFTLSQTALIQTLPAVVAST